MAASLAEFLFHWVAAAPDRAYLAEPETGAGASYGEVATRIAAMWAALEGRGARAGDRVALLAQNSIAWVVAYLAALAHGAVVVPLNARLAGAELAAVLADCEPAVIVAEPALATRLPPASQGRVLSTEDLGTAGGGTDAIAAAPGRLASIAYTSGTTGEPQGVMLSHRALVTASATYARLFGSGPDLATAVAVPLCHNTGFIDVLGHTLVAGGRMDIYRRFRGGPLGRAVLDGTYSYLILVPTMIGRMVEALGEAAPSTAAPWLAYGGAPMPAAVAERLARLVPAARLVNCYGLTEATSMTHYLPWRPGPRALGAIGLAAPGTLDRLGPGGELQVVSPTVMEGYWRRPDASRAKFDGRWLRTGDLAERGADGFLHIVGRADELINRGGEKFAPLEIEHAATAHPDVVEAAVVGLAHDDLGQVAGAAVVRRRDSTLDAETLRAFLAGRVADFKLPQQVAFVDSLPRNPNGKLVRAAVRALLEP